MIPPRPRLPNSAPEPARAPQPPSAAPRRSAETAREMIGALRERFGTAPLVDRRATGHLDAETVIGSAPAACDLEKVVVPGRDSMALGPMRQVPTSKLKL